MMEKDDKALDRFGFTQPDKCIKVSQCVRCSNNLGKPCRVYGEKPRKYVSASVGEKCPRRKVD